MNQRGFTSLELLISTALFAVLLLGGVVVTRTAGGVAHDSTSASGAEVCAMRAHDQIRRELSMAGRSTLLAVPAAGGAPAPMVDGVAYDNVTYRRTLTSGPGGPTYDPLPADPPVSLSFQPRPGTGGGELIATDATGNHPRCGSLSNLTFTKSGSRILVRVTAIVRGAAGDDCTAVRTIVLRNP
jgi:hypothetical protein